MLCACESLDTNYDVSGTADGYEYVDLCLSSGTKWATCNVGANSPEDYGDYFAWGETFPKSIYDSNSYKWMRGSYYTKYCIDKNDGVVDNKKTLDFTDDAAYVNLGSSWRMPTKKELDELRDECIWTYTTQNGVNGYRVTSRINDKSIFLPAAGYRSDSNLYDDVFSGNYWGSSLNANKSRTASTICFRSTTLGNNDFSRATGLSVRAVLR